MLRSFFILLPLTALASALQMIVATFARSYKEAQTYLSFLMILPVVPGVVLSMVPFKPEAWMMCIPALGEQLLIHRLGWATRFDLEGLTRAEYSPGATIGSADGASSSPG